MLQDHQESSEFLFHYEQHKKAIFNYILYRVGFNRDQAEDLTSEIFLKAFEHFDSYDRSRSFKTWIFTIAHNHLVNYFIGRKETLLIDEAREIAREAGPAETVEKEMTLARLMHFIGDLPASQRELIIMKYINDMNNREIAGITGKEEGAVRTALSRAITALRGAYNANLSPPNP